MAMLAVRNLPDDVHRALRARAAEHGRSTEAEVREILAAAVKPQTRVRLGDAIAALAQTAGLTGEDVEALERTKGKTPAEPLKYPLN
jgi:plasmid stability protein